MELSITLIIIIITGLISFSAFSNQKIIDDLIFYPPSVTERGQWYRFFTCELIHADIGHLLFNMISLYMFGEFVERSFSTHILFGEKGIFLYLGMYVLALFVCLVPTFIKHKNDYYYRSLGASGAESAVVFAGTLFDPTIKIGFFFIPPVIRGYIFGPLYLIASTYLEKQAKDNVNHSRFRPPAGLPLPPPPRPPRRAGLRPVRRARPRTVRRAGPARVPAPAGPLVAVSPAAGRPRLSFFPER